MRIDIGGGTAPMGGYVNLDPVHGEDEWKRHAQSIWWPCEPDSVDAIRASHVMEHIPAGEGRISVFNEAWRVLRPGGTFTVIVPMFPTPQAIADPTHVSWWVPESFGYFDGRIQPNADYGIRLWTHFDTWVVDEWELHWVGVKPGE